MPDLENVGNIFASGNFNASQQYVRERYAMMGLLLFCPFQNRDDLKMNNSYMTKYQWFLSFAPMHAFVNTKVLDNIQRRHNALKEHMVEDSLITETKEFDAQANNYEDNDDMSDDDEDVSGIDLSALDDNNVNIGIINQEQPITTTLIQQRGKNYCGHDTFDTPLLDNSATVFISHQHYKMTRQNTSPHRKEKQANKP